MADAKITALSALTTPALEDLLPIIDDPAGSPITKKIALSALMVNPAFVVPGVLFTCNDADFTGANTTNVQPIFQAANDRLTVLASTTYLFDLQMYVTNGATTCTKGLDFSGGTCTFTSCNYLGMGQTANSGVTGTTQSSCYVIVSTITTILATGTTGWWIKASGMMRINAGGTLLPQFKFSADPTGAVLIKKDSYMWLYPIGSNTVAFAGPWA